MGKLHEVSQLKPALSHDQFERRQVQGAARGGRQKEFDHFFFQIPVTFSDASVTFSVTFLPDSFCWTLLRIEAEGTQSQSPAFLQSQGTIARISCSESDMSPFNRRKRLQSFAFAKSRRINATHLCDIKHQIFAGFSRGELEVTIAITDIRAISVHSGLGGSPDCVPGPFTLGFSVYVLLAGQERRMNLGRSWEPNQ